MRTATPARYARAIGVVAVTGSLAATLLGVLAPGAGATDVTAHNPIGKLRSLTATSTGLQVTGWAADPDALSSNVTVFGIVDGSHHTPAVTTSRHDAKARARHGTGPTPGFALSVPVPAGNHTVCLVARNLGAGMSSLLRCVPTPLGRTLSAAQRAAHNPQGSFGHMSASRHAARFTGWTSDPDMRTRRGVVVAYIDGHPAATVTTHTYPGQRPVGAGRWSAFRIDVPVSVGTHVGCIWVVNAGIGTGNTFLGCKTVDTRGKAGTGPVTVPTLNKNVAAVAKKQIGKPYVWGATGPKTFDCSGLVLWSYHKFGYTTPRISEDQAVAARLIPAARAVPGDLVFYHDSEGDVYHVGIYLGPGLTVAAIDTQQGVDYQQVWDPSSTTYGSFTHT